MVSVMAVRELARSHPEASPDDAWPPPEPPQRRWPAHPDEEDYAVRIMEHGSVETIENIRKSLQLRRLGPSYQVTIGRLRLILRDVRTDSELTADLAVAYNGVHLFRTTTTLSVTARKRLADQAIEMAGFQNSEQGFLRRCFFAAVEAVLAAEEQVGQPVDLRTADVALPSGGTHVVTRFWPYGSVGLVSPGDSGKSTMARAVAVSIAHGVQVIPGLEPVGTPRPVLYVAGEDPAAHWHAQSIDAICRGIGVDRATLAQPVELFDPVGRPLHRIARALAERAADFGAIILDSQQTLLPQLSGDGNLRDRDTLFWHAVDQIRVPVMVIAHPNRADARDWQKAEDGRIAGSEVNRDRLRMAWRGTFKDEPAVTGTSYRRYTLTNTKHNHLAREAPIVFAAAWEYGYGGAPSVLRFHECDAVVAEVKPSPQLAETLTQYRAGHTTASALAKALDIPENTAKSRLRLLREKGLLTDGDGHE